MTDFQFNSGEWTGFFVEAEKPGWMHLFLVFKDGSITGEGTDYVGPWHIRGSYDEKTGECSWVKQYLKKHHVEYSGKFVDGTGIVGVWNIGGYLTGEFRIWPKGYGGIDEMYLAEPEPHAAAY